MISYVLGYNSSEYVDETILVMLYMFALGRPPAVQYDYATFIVEKIHEVGEREGIQIHLLHISSAIVQSA